MIAAGAALLRRYPGTPWLLALILIAASLKVLLLRHDNVRPARNPVLRLLRRVLPLSRDGSESRWVVTRGDGRALTSLAACLVIVQSNNVLFALGSVPAAYAVTQEPFLVYTSNAFALLGLRSLYFALAGVLERLRYVKTSLVFVLLLAGVKLLVAERYPISDVATLAAVATIVGLGLAACFLAPTRRKAPLRSPLADEIEELTRVGIRQARRVAILLLGSTLLLLGTAMVVLPGPGFLTIFGGLSLLALEFAWARRWLANVKAAAETAKRQLRRALARDEPLEAKVPEKS